MRLLAAWLLALVVQAGFAQVPVVAAAANVKHALDEIALSFERETGKRLRIAYGSTGSLAQQVAHGAPFELFLSADEATVDRLASAGLARDRGTVYATGRLALFVPRGSPLQLDAALADLAKAIADGRVRRFAIANPEHAPYGQAARQVLERAGLWAAIRPRLVYGENVAQAMQFAAGPDAQGGLVPLALAISPQAGAGGSFVPIPESEHAPLRQRMALLARATPAAADFYAYLQGSAAKAILARHGYDVPGAPR